MASAIQILFDDFATKSDVSRIIKRTEKLEVMVTTGKPVRGQSGKRKIKAVCF